MAGVVRWNNKDFHDTDGDANCCCIISLASLVDDVGGCTPPGFEVLIALFAHLSVLQHIRFYVINHISFLSNKYEVSSTDYKPSGLG